MADNDNWSQYAMQCQCEMENLSKQLQIAEQTIIDLTIELNELKQRLENIFNQDMNSDT